METGSEINRKITEVMDFDAMDDIEEEEEEIVAQEEPGV